MFLKIAVLAYIGFYYGGIILLRSYLLYQKTGIHSIQHLHKEGIAWFNQKLLITCSILISFIGLNYVLLPNNYLLLVPIPYLVSEIISKLGILLSLIGLSLGFIAQLQMGDSWRLGENHQEKTALIKKGVLPIFSQSYLSIFINSTSWLFFDAAQCFELLFFSHVLYCF